MASTQNNYKYLILIIFSCQACLTGCQKKEKAFIDTLNPKQKIEQHDYDRLISMIEEDSLSPGEEESCMHIAMQQALNFGDTSIITKILCKFGTGHFKNFPRVAKKYLNKDDSIYIITEIMDSGKLENIYTVQDIICAEVNSIASQFTLIFSGGFSDETIIKNQKYLESYIFNHGDDHLQKTYKMRLEKIILSKDKASQKAKVSETAEK